MEYEEQQIRDELSRNFLDIAKDSFMFDNIISFVALSRENTSVRSVDLYPFDSEPGTYKFWDEVGQIVGNLKELDTINIHFLYHFDDHGDEARIPDWETITRILPYVRQDIALTLSAEENYAEVEEIQGLARAIHGHPMISEFDCRTGKFTFENVGHWCSTLAALPRIHCVVLGLREPETEEQRVLLNLEPLKELLRTPTLRLVRFEGFYFTNELCHATANALEAGSSIIDITFDSDCSFPDGGKAVIANALQTNATVTSVEFFGDCDKPFCNSLAVALLCNSTLQNLTLQLPKGAIGRWPSSIFLALGMNTSLKSLSVGILDKLEDKLCAAIRNGLAKNSTLEDLSLLDVLPSDDDGAVSARNALSFLLTNSTLMSLSNSTLKSLTVSFVRGQSESYASAFRLGAVKVMEDNRFLESLTIVESSGSGIKVEELLALLSALQLNTTLKTLGFQLDCFGSITFTVDEVNQLVLILMKNYGLERLSPAIPCADDGTVKAILRLNRAGRRYLIKDGSSISKGVDVLSAVSDEIDCVFLHLLENPSLCDRRSAETTTGRRRPSANLDDSSSTGKRE
jgi:hypothetical protein